MLLTLALAAISCHSVTAAPTTNYDLGKINSLEQMCKVLQKKQADTDKNLLKLTTKLKENKNVIEKLRGENKAQQSAIDSLQKVCKDLEVTQSRDRKTTNGKIDATDSNVQANQELLQARTLWGIIIVFAFLVIITTIAYLLTRRIQSGNSTISDVRKAQEALQAAQTKMQEESIKLDNQLLAIVQKQLDASTASTNKTTGEPDHSLVVKLADEIARIETNLSKMDKSVRGYKQLVQAKDRMINNVRANGYEIISLLGQEYNDGMQFQTRFVPNESLPEGKRVITGMIKMQVNYNGKMIQPAEIVVSQNI